MFINEAASITTQKSPRYFYIALAVAAVVFPLLIWQFSLPSVSSSYGPLHIPFELFGLTASAALIIYACLEIRRSRGFSLLQMAPLALFLLVAFHFLIVMVEFEAKSFDYSCYENAAMAIVQGNTPYADEAYLYPPFTAQVMALAYRMLEPVVTALPMSNGPEAGWFYLFYLYQCAQYLLLLAAFVLCRRFVRRLGVDNLTASVMVAAVFLLNNPLVRTLKHHQVNLWILDFMLLAVLFLSNRAWISGLAVAIAAHIKLYPLILLLPWTMMKKWKAAVWSVIGVVGIALIQTGWGSNWELYRQYMAFSQKLHLRVEFRDNGIYGIVYNTYKMLGQIFKFDVQGQNLTVNLVAWVLTVVVIAWFAIRFMRREAAFKSCLTGSSAISPDTIRSFGHFTDSLALMLMISPIVWEHHYVLAVPIILWALAMCGRKKPWITALAALLILGVPTFDVYPFSYHRLAGLIILTMLTSPEVMSKQITEDDTAANERGRSDINAAPSA
jgi:alpha-1,2-mannosyltransferase